MINVKKIINPLENENGNSMMELIMVMLLLAFFGVTMCTLIVTGSETQGKIIAQKDNQVDGRIALSYLNVRVRQNDKIGCIAVKEHPVTGKNALFISDFEPDYYQDLWIFEEDGYLKEIMVTAGDPYPETAPSDKIVEIDHMDISMDGNKINISINYEYGDGIETLSSTLYLRSAKN